MARSLLGEIIHQLTGLGESNHKKRSHKKHYYNKAQRETDKFLYKCKEAQFEAKKEFEIAKHRAKSKGWI